MWLGLVWILNVCWMNTIEMILTKENVFFLETLLSTKSYKICMAKFAKKFDGWRPNKTVSCGLYTGSESVAHARTVLTPAKVDEKFRATPASLWRVGQQMGLSHDFMFSVEYILSDFSKFFVVVCTVWVTFFVDHPVQEYFFSKYFKKIPQNVEFELNITV